MHTILRPYCVVNRGMEWVSVQTLEPTIRWEMGREDMNL